MRKLLITGANGQLGSEIQFLAKQYPNYELVLTDFAELDITNLSAVLDFVKGTSYYAVINCAAYTAVDKAETEIEKAYQINEIGAANLATAAKQLGAKFIHVSTDFIFDGTHSSPILEDDKPNPISVYGASKLAGEKAVMEANMESVIFRTSWVYSSYGANFVKTIIRLCRERDSLSIIYDQIGTPTYARDLAQTILSTLDKVVEKKISGFLNFSNEGIASWYDFAIAIRDMAGLSTRILPIETSQYPTPAARPKYSVLNKRKIKETFQLEIPYWRDSLKSCVALLQE